ncbi:MAG: flagellar biosynthetic protein FliP [Nitrospirae bacterium]|nr:MAG: flagellar biosynthetic protein FliP [Nitrospirota bacterium]
MKRHLNRWALLIPLLIPSTAMAFDLREIDSPALELFVLLSLLSILPALIVMLTSFTRVVVVLGFMRQAIGGQQIPPTPVIIGLSLFLTLYIMSPVIENIEQKAVRPYLDKEISLGEAIKRAEPELKAFMLRQTRQKDLELFVNLKGLKDIKSPEDLPMTVVVPAFAISELTTAFEIGFLIYLPFLVIDMVVSSVLLSLGMMMLPPVLISLPFKLILFVLVDGWNLMVGSIVRSFQ